MTLNPACARRTYAPASVRLRPEAIYRFIRALQEDNPYFTDFQRRGGIVAPPLYAAVLALPAICEAMADPDLGAPRAEVLPVMCEFILARPIRAPREIHVTASFGDVIETDQGTTAALLVQGTRARGVLVFTGQIRLLHPKTPGAAEIPPPASQFLRHSLAFRAHFQVLKELRQFMPDRAGPEQIGTAESFLAHTLGLSYAARAIIDSSLGRDPAQIKRITGWPVRALTPGEAIETAGWITEARRGTTYFGFEILAEDGSLVMADGRAEVVLRE